MSDDRLYLSHNLERIDRIYDFTRDGQASFTSNVLVQDGVIRNLEVIGEAIRQLTPVLTEHYPQVPWRRIAGLRNVLIHE